jgi:hypothetical protein
MPNTNSEQNLLPGKTQGPSKDISRRLIRLVIAVYRVTDFFDEKEPIKYGLRTTGVELLRGSMSFIHPENIIKQELLRDIKDGLNTLYVQCDVLEYSRIVSEMNSKLLKDEIMSLITLVENSSFNGNLMVDVGQLNKGISWPVTVDQSFNSKVDTPKENYGHNNPLLANGRKTTIIDYLKLKGSASIKDLTSVVKGCSEKTIQRELGALINMSVIRKEGDKRWSRYLIADLRPL